MGGQKTDLPWLGRRWRSRLVYALIVGLSCLACWLPSVQANPDKLALDQPAQIIAQGSLEQGQQLYNDGQLQQAAQVLQQLVDTASSSQEQVVALRNLALVYQQLGQWEGAAAAIAQAQSVLTTTSIPDQSLLLAQLLDVQAGLQLDQGQGEAAIVTWQRSEALYTQLNQSDVAIQAQINQAQAMQQLGFHRRAIATLRPVIKALTSQPASLNTAVAQRILGDSLLQVGSFPEAQAALETSQAIAQQLSSPGLASAVALSLGNLKAALGNTEAALIHYNEVDNINASPLLRIQAQLNQLSILAKTGQLSQVQAIWPRILTNLNTLPPNQSTLFAKINLAQTLIELPVTANLDPRTLADLLVVTWQQAQALGDRRSESFAMGTLGHLYERLEQWSDAINLSRSALALAQEINASDITYRWQWQLGRLYKTQNQLDKAIAAYRNAVDILQELRTDLVAVNPAVQVSFQSNVEPIHRELVSLLLDPNRGVTPDDLDNARATIESLQLAELDNFFREACLDTVSVNIDQLDQRAAVVYPLILADRLEVIVSLPDQPLRHYTSPVSEVDLNEVIENLQQLLVLRVGRQYLPFAQQLYDWMMRPIVTDLVASDVDTLVFVLDGELRNLPMAVLHDGNQFLLEQYSVAYTPGLQLVDPQPLQNQSLRVVTAGLSEARQGFSALPNVVEEVKQIEATVPATAVLLDDEFTLQALQRSLTFEGAPIVHLATHGKFSSSNEETFVLTWDDRLDITTLNSLLKTSELNQNGPIELLVLSACQTATGDKRAALGLAGLAVRSGARSTIATLWQVNDAVTAMLMSQLYDNLTNPQLTKAEALRQAQLTVLQEPRFRQHPFYWSPYVLVGNWL